MNLNSETMFLKAVRNSLFIQDTDYLSTFHIFNIFTTSIVSLLASNEMPYKFNVIPFSNNTLLSIISRGPLILDLFYKEFPHAILNINKTRKRFI